MTLTITFWGATVTILGLFASAIIALTGVTLGGVLVLRARSNGYEPILPPLRDKSPGALNVDDFEDQQVDEDRQEFSMDDVTEEIEKIFAERKEEDPNNPAQKANARFNEQQ